MQNGIKKKINIWFFVSNCEYIKINIEKINVTNIKISILFFRFLFLFNKKKFIKLVINFVIWRLRKKYNLLYSDTHQEILNKLSKREKNKYQHLFKIFEIAKYSNKEIRYSLIFKSLI